MRLRHLIAHWRRLALLATIGLLLLCGIWLLVRRDTAPAVRLIDKTFHVDVVDTPANQEKGLSGRERLARDEGMLFVFSSNGRWCFWMKDMKFDIDILWFDDEFKLVHRAERVSPKTYPRNFCSQADARYVLEVQAGTAERLGLQQGDRLKPSNIKL